MKKLHKRHPISRGFTMIELLIAMMLLLAVMRLAGTLIYRTDLVWRDVARNRLAMNELSNQMEELTVLSPVEIQSRLQSIEPSKLCQQSLLNATLSGQATDDDLGTRISLKLNWKRKHPGQPIKLVGWASPSLAQSPPQEPNK